MVKKTCCDCESLRRIISLGQRIHSLLEARSPSPTSVPSSSEGLAQAVAIPPINLPLPDDITQPLVDGGCSQTAAQMLSEAFAKSARLIQARYTSLYQDTCKRWTNSSSNLHPFDISAVAPFVESDYRKHLAVAKQMVVDRVGVLCRGHAHPSLLPQKPTFNQEFVPLLEKYFEYNPYPSAADRSALARKSMMTPRQIEVWFQNHRNRAKKEGKVFRRDAADTLLQHISLDSLERSMPFFVIPEKERQDPFNTSKVEEEAKGETNITMIRPVPPQSFTFVAPPHAFPAPFSSRCGYDPFPANGDIFKLPSAVWPRQPTVLQTSRHPVNVEELIRDFTVKLTMREPLSRKLRRKIDAHGQSPTPWFASRYSTASPAPHPAFVPSPPLTPHGPSLLPINVKTPHFPFLPVCPSAERTISTSPRVSSQRKVATLHEHAPKNTSLSSRANSPLVSDTSAIPSRPSSGSGSSSTSFPSSRGPSTSSGASSSTLGTPSTPILFRPALLGNNPYAISLSGLDSIDLYGNARRLLSYRENLSFNNSDSAATPTKNLFSSVPPLLTSHA